MWDTHHVYHATIIEFVRTRGTEEQTKKVEKAMSLVSNILGEVTDDGPPW